MERQVETMRTVYSTEADIVYRTLQENRETIPKEDSNLIGSLVESIDSELNAMKEKRRRRAKRLLEKRAKARAVSPARLASLAQNVSASKAGLVVVDGLLYANTYRASVISLSTVAFYLEKEIRAFQSTLSYRIEFRFRIWPSYTSIDISPGLALYIDGVRDFRDMAPFLRRIRPRMVGNLEIHNVDSGDSRFWTWGKVSIRANLDWIGRGCERVQVGVETTPVYEIRCGDTGE